ncbi:MAG: HEAT repeat domain-containing protein [Actinobacteria bacterium]|nr:HEAT repeat domain-containing protein [Actinomycetota bacterium]
MPRSDPNDRWPADPFERAAAAAAIGLRGQTTPDGADELAALVAGDRDSRVRAAALGALSRLPDPPTAAWLAAAGDRDPSVRRRAAELAPSFVGADVATGLLGLLSDDDGSVAEVAAWALGELGVRAADGGTVPRLAQAATRHRDPLVREAAVAALGALGDPDGLEAVLAACRDKPAIRRRAVLALAAFEGPEVDAALQAALDDKDWQTRQAAEDLLD